MSHKFTICTHVHTGTRQRDSIPNPKTDITKLHFKNTIIKKPLKDNHRVQ